MKCVIASLISKHLSNILVEYLHGFRSGQLSTKQLVTSMDDVIKCFDRGDSVYAAILDFSKAFDRVSQHLLVTKLITTGFFSTIVKEISSFSSRY